MRTTLAHHGCTCRLDWVDVAISSQLLRGRRRTFSFSVVGWRKMIGWMSQSILLKSMMLAIHAHSPKLWKHFNALLRELGGSKRVTLSRHWKPKAKIRSVKSSNVDSADSNEVLLWQKHQDMCLVWNLNLAQASHLTSDLGKTNAFAILMNVSVEDSSTFFAREERSGKVKLSWRLEAV